MHIACIDQTAEKTIGCHVNVGHNSNVAKTGFHVTWIFCGSETESMIILNSALNWRGSAQVGSGNLFFIWTSSGEGFQY